MKRLHAIAQLRPEFFSEILNSINDAVYITDKNGMTLWVNSTSEEMCNIPKEKLIGRSVQELEKEKVFTPSVTRLALEAKKNISTVQEMRDGRKFIATGHLVKEEHGQVIAVVAHCRDITEAVKTSSRLKETEELLEKYSLEIKKLYLSTRQSNPEQKEQMIDNEIENIINKISRVDTTALIIGETGTGKSVTAERIHLLCNRHSQPFIQINCASMPESLLESELFGYMRGAFTGANKTGQQGLIQAAEGGTLFLDEIGELPIHLQAKLLHFLQTKTYLPIGGRQYKRANVRIIAATNRKLDQMVEEGKFRADLYFRLNILTIKLPPIRGRKEHIRDLSFYYLRKFNEKYHTNKIFSPDVLKTFHSYKWPGNVRELENLIEKLVVLSEQNITMNDLPRKMLQKTLDSTSFTYPVKGQTMPEYLEMIEKDILLKALDQEESTRKAAKALGVTQSLLMRRIRKYNIKLLK